MIDTRFERYADLPVIPEDREYPWPIREGDYIKDEDTGWEFKAHKVSWVVSEARIYLLVQVS